jgi:hypothetical protein
MAASNAGERAGLLLTPRSVPIPEKKCCTASPVSSQILDCDVGLVVRSSSA